MSKKFFTSLFLIVYLSVSTVSFAEEVVLEIVSEMPAPIQNIIPEPTPEVISNTPIVEEIVPPVENINDPFVQTVPVSPEVTPVQEEREADTTEANQIEFIPESTIIESVLDILQSAPEETTEELLEDIPTTEVPTTTIVEVEENSVFTPPGPEPEPWQPAVREDPTTESNTLVGDVETQSDPAFLAENSVFVRHMIEDVVVDYAAKHSCRVDVFHTDISETAISTLLVKFYGTSLLASYDAEIGGLPNGIDVRFEKNNDYIYDFRGKETTLELVVTKQDSSLSGDFTIPIIYTQKGKKESTVICQLNIINEEDILPVLPLVEPVEVVVDPVLESERIIEEITPPTPEIPLVQHILDVVDTTPVTPPEPVVPPEIPITETPADTILQDILDVVAPPEIVIPPQTISPELDVVQSEIPPAVPSEIPILETSTDTILQDILDVVSPTPLTPPVDVSST